MKKKDEIQFLIKHHGDAFIKERRKVFSELSDMQAVFCCCGKLATGLHEDHCAKFNDKVDTETIKRLEYLLPTKGGHNGKE